MAYEMDEQERQAAAQGSAPGAALPTAAPSSHGGSAGGAPGTGFQNLSAYFGANRDAATAQASSLAGRLDAQANSATARDDMGAAADVRGQIQSAQTQPGLASLYREGAPPTYTAGQAGLDAYLSGQGGGERFGQLSRWFGYLDAAGRPSAPSTPSPAPEDPQPPRIGKPEDPTGTYGPPVDDEEYDPRHPGADTRKNREIY